MTRQILVCSLLVGWGAPLAASERGLLGAIDGHAGRYLWGWVLTVDSHGRPVPADHAWVRVVRDGAPDDPRRADRPRADLERLTGDGALRDSGFLVDAPAAAGPVAVEVAASSNGPWQSLGRTRPSEEPFAAFGPCHRAVLPPQRQGLEVGFETEELEAVLQAPPTEVLVANLWVYEPRLDDDQVTIEGRLGEGPWRRAPVANGPPGELAPDQVIQLPVGSLEGVQRLELSVREPGGGRRIIARSVVALTGSHLIGGQE